MDLAFRESWKFKALRAVQRLARPAEPCRGSQLDLPLLPVAPGGDACDLSPRWQRGESLTIEGNPLL